MRPPLPPSINQRVQNSNSPLTKKYEQFSSSDSASTQSAAKPERNEANPSQFPLHTKEVDNPIANAEDRSQKASANPYDEAEEENVEF